MLCCGEAGVLALLPLSRTYEAKRLTDGLNDEERSISVGSIRHGQVREPLKRSFKGETDELKLFWGSRRHCFVILSAYQEELRMTWQLQTREVSKSCRSWS